MNKKAQVLIISLWVMIILSMLAISISQRVSWAMQLSHNAENKLKSIYLAKAGMNLALAEILKGTKIADKLELFQNITLEGVEYGSAEVFEVTDAESKININTAPQKLLEALFNKIGAAASAELAANTYSWKSSKRKFVNTQELMLVDGMDGLTADEYDKLQSLVTTYGNGKVNLNTAPLQTVDILIDYARIKLQEAGNNQNNPENLRERIIQNRAFSDRDDFNEKLKNQGSPGSGQINIINELEELTDFKSACFYVHSGGKMKNINSHIYCVFDRESKKIIYWHEI